MPGLHERDGSAVQAAPNDAMIYGNQREIGAGEAIRTLDPNLGKQEIALSKHCGSISQISFRYARVTVLLVFAGLAARGRDDTLMN